MNTHTTRPKHRANGEHQPLTTSTSEQTALGIGEVDLDQTLDGGQAFMWRKQASGRYRGVLQAKVVDFIDCGGDVEVWGNGHLIDANLLAHARSYFDSSLDVDILRIRLGGEPGFGTELEEGPVLRVLRQEPWECLVAFICSQNSNIPRIKTMIASVGSFGTAIGTHPWEFVLPSPEEVADVGESRLREVGLGYRAKHLSQTAGVVASGAVDLHALRSANYEDAKDALISLPGVGPKVADCVLAYSLDKREAFPVDVHVRRAVERLYGLREGMKYEDIGEWARDRFGEWAAIAQLYLFRNQINLGRTVPS